MGSNLLLSLLWGRLSTFEANTGVLVTIQNGEQGGICTHIHTVVCVVTHCARC